LKSLWFSYAVGLVFNLILNMLLIIVPLYAALLGTTPLFIGLAVSLPAFVMVLLRIPGGLLSDRIGSRRVALLALAAMCVAAALLAQAGNIWLIMVSQLFSGFARGVFWPSIQSYVSKLQVFTIGQRLGWFTGATSIGGVAGPVLGGVMVAVAGYRSAFVLLAVLSAVALVLILGLEDPVTARAGSTGVTGIVEDISSLIRNPNVYRTGLAAFLAAVPLATASSFYPLYVKWIGQPPEIIGTLSSFRTVMVGLGALAFGSLVARLGNRRTFMVGAMAGLAAYALTPAFRTLPTLAAAFTLIGVSQVVLNLASLTMVGQWSSPRRRGLAMAVNGTFWSLSLLVTPTVLGALTQAYSIEVAFYWLATVVLILTLVGYVWLGREVSMRQVLAE